MGGRRRTRPVSPTAATNYFKKAKEFAAAMEAALAEKHWNAAALNAVHAAISAGDALLAAFVGLRSADQDHRQIVALLSDHLGEVGAQAAKHVQRVIARKNLVEYEERLIRPSEAQQAVEHVRRLLELVERQLE